MEQKFNPEVIKRLQGGVEPNTEGKSPIEVIVADDADRKRKLEEMIALRQRNTHVSAPPPLQEITIIGHRVSKDFFTCLTLALIYLNDKKVNKVLDEFNFEMKDLDGKQIYPLKRIKKMKRRK